MSPSPSPSLGKTPSSTSSNFPSLSASPSPSFSPSPSSGKSPSPSPSPSPVHVQRLAADWIPFYDPNITEIHQPAGLIEDKIILLCGNRIYGYRVTGALLWETVLSGSTDLKGGVKYQPTFSNSTMFVATTTSLYSISVDSGEIVGKFHSQHDSFFRVYIVGTVALYAENQGDAYNVYAFETGDFYEPNIEELIPDSFHGNYVARKGASQIDLCIFYVDQATGAVRTPVRKSMENNNLIISGDIILYDFLKSGGWELEVRRLSPTGWSDSLFSFRSTPTLSVHFVSQNATEFAIVTDTKVRLFDRTTSSTDPVDEFEVSSGRYGFSTACNCYWQISGREITFFTMGSHEERARYFLPLPDGKFTTILEQDVDLERNLLYVSIKSSNVWRFPLPDKQASGEIEPLSNLEIDPTSWSSVKFTSTGVATWHFDESCGMQYFVAGSTFTFYTGHSNSPRYSVSVPSSGTIKFWSRAIDCKVPYGYRVNEQDETTDLKMVDASTSKVSNVATLPPYPGLLCSTSSMIALKYFRVISGSNTACYFIIKPPPGTSSGTCDPHSFCAGDCVYLFTASGASRKCGTPTLSTSLNWLSGRGLSKHFHDEESGSILLLDTANRLYRLDVLTGTIVHLGDLQFSASSIFLRGDYFMVYSKGVLSGYRLPFTASKPIWEQRLVLDGKSVAFFNDSIILQLKPPDGSQLVSIDYTTGAIDWLFDLANNFLVHNSRLFVTIDGERHGFDMEAFPSSRSRRCCTSSGVNLHMLCSCMEVSKLPFLNPTLQVAPKVTELRYLAPSPTVLNLAVFRQLPYLHTLHMEGIHHLQNVEQEDPLPALRELLISNGGQSLTTPESWEKGLGHLYYLTRLTIANTTLPPVEVIPFDLFPKLRLAEIYLQRTVEVIDLSQMRFPDNHLSFDLKLSGVEAVQLIAPSDYSIQHATENLILSNIEIDSIAIEALCNFPSLRQLDLSENRLKSFHSIGSESIQRFKSATSLKALDLTGNALIFTAPFPAHWSLESLFLARNSLTTLPERFLSGLPKLNALDLSFNRFNSLNVSSMGTTGLIVNSVNLEGNPLEHISPGVATFLSSAPHLHLGNDPDQTPILDLSPCSSQTGRLHCLGKFTASGLLYCTKLRSGEHCGDTGVEWCPAGSYCVEGIVEPCPRNSYSRAGAPGCTPCPEGSSSVEGSPSCLTCGERQIAVFDDFLGTLTCQPCRAGYYFDEELVSCEECPLGAYCLANTDMQVCPLGRYNNVRKATKCKECPSGTVGNTQCVNSVSCASSVETACLSCPPGRFSNVAGAEQCEVCPSGRYASHSGARSATDCDACDAGALCGAGATSPFPRDAFSRSLRSTVPDAAFSVLSRVSLGEDRPSARQIVFVDYFPMQVASNEAYDPTVFLLVLSAGGGVSLVTVVMFLVAFRKRFGGVLKTIDLYALSHPVQPGEAIRSRPSGAGGAFTVGLLAVALTLLGSNLYEFFTNNTDVSTTLRPSLDLTNVETQLFEFVLNVVVADPSKPAWCQNSTLAVDSEEVFVSTDATWMSSNETSVCRLTASCTRCSVPISTIFRVRIPLSCLYVSWYMHTAGANGDTYGVASVDDLRSQGGMVAGASILLEALPEKIEDSINQKNYTGFSINSRLTQYINPGLRFVQLDQSAEYTFELTISALAKYTTIEMKQTIVELFSAYFGLLLGIMGVFGALFKILKLIARKKRERVTKLHRKPWSTKDMELYLRDRAPTTIASISKQPWATNPLVRADQTSHKQGE